MNEEVKNYIASTEENLKQASLIAENLTAAKIKIQWLFWKNLKEKMITKGLKLGREKEVSEKNVENFYTKTQNRDIYYGFEVEEDMFKMRDITICFRIEISDQLYYGFTLKENGKEGIPNLDNYDKYKYMVKNINKNYKNDLYWLGWRYTEETLDFRSFSSDSIFELADRKKLDKKVTTIANNILNDINGLKIKLDKN
jgi:hypothetical protein